MEEMIIDSLKINAMGQRVLILKQKKGPLFLAIWIAAAEADAIAIRMQKVEIPRPLTHDLLCNAIEKSGGKIKSVQIEKVENTVFPRFKVAKGNKLGSFTKRSKCLDILNFLFRFNKGNNCDSVVLCKVLNKIVVTDSISTVRWKWTPKA